MKKYIGFVVIIAMAAMISCKREYVPLDSKVIFSFGTVTVNGNTVDGAEVSVKFGDVIETGDDGLCEIQVAEKSILRLNKNTKLVFKLSKDSSVLELKKGWLAGVTRKIFSMKGTYLIKTPTVTASIRGTSYCIKVENSLSTYFCVCNGTINLTGKDAEKGEDVKASHHAAARFKIEGGALEVDKNPGMLYHGDDTIEALNRKIGEKIDWQEPFED